MLKEHSRSDLENEDLNSLVPDVRVDRRGFIAGCLAAGFAVTAEPVLAQAIKTPMDGLVGGDTKIGDIPAYYAVRKGADKRPVVLVVAEIWGNHEHIKDVVRRLAKAGYFAVANEPYFRIGELWKMENIKEVIAAANQLSDEQVAPDQGRGEERAAGLFRDSSVQAIQANYSDLPELLAQLGIKQVDGILLDLRKNAGDPAPVGGVQRRGEKLVAGHRCVGELVHEGKQLDPAGRPIGRASTAEPCRYRCRSSPNSFAVE